mmetsp:Transcript_32414/g.86986  ORF Transcript_32414/g.86986 Transcript_32414/m.86986 type:complete len:244 (-) Transcript_32414:94-825(-)
MTNSLTASRCSIVTSYNLLASCRDSSSSNVMSATKVFLSLVKSLVLMLRNMSKISSYSKQKSSSASKIRKSVRILSIRLSLQRSTRAVAISVVRTAPRLLRSTLWNSTCRISSSTASTFRSVSRHKRMSSRKSIISCTPAPTRLRLTEYQSLCRNFTFSLSRNWALTKPLSSPTHLCCLRCCCCCAHPISPKVSATLCPPTAEVDRIFCFVNDLKNPPFSGPIAGKSGDTRIFLGEPWFSMSA